MSGDSCAVEGAARSPDAAGADVNGTVSRGAKRGHEHADGMRGVRARSGDVVERVGAHNSSRSAACRSSQVAPAHSSPVLMVSCALRVGGAARAADGARRDGESTVETVSMERRADGTSAAAAPTSSGDSDAHCGQVSRNDEMRGRPGRREWKSIFTDSEGESEPEGDTRSCARKRERVADDEMDDMQREPSKRRVDSTDAPTGVVRTPPPPPLSPPLPP